MPNNNEWIFKSRNNKHKPSDFVNTFTYIVEEDGGEFVKIGRTSQKDYFKRHESLQTGNPRELRVLLLVTGDYEGQLHKKFRSSRIRGDWFRYTSDIRAWVEENQDLDIEESNTTTECQLIL